MYAFFVLGIIPGTNLQITFNMWLGGIVILIGVSLEWLYRNHSFVYQTMRYGRQTLHASQLHQRAL